MRIKLDENLLEGLADLLRSAKYDVATALEENLSGAKDPVVTAAVKQEGRLFMTYDIGFRRYSKVPAGKPRGHRRFSTSGSEVAGSGKAGAPVD